MSTNLGLSSGFFIKHFFTKCANIDGLLHVGIGT